MTVDVITKTGQPCLVCLNEDWKIEHLQKILPDKIMEIENLDFLPKNDNPVGQSNAFLCGICGLSMVA